MANGIVALASYFLSETTKAVMFKHACIATSAKTRLGHRIRLVLYFTLASLFYTPVAHANDANDELSDLSPAGWTRNVELVGLKIDQYRSDSGSIKIDLIAFPPTDSSAAQWIDSVLPIMLQKGRDIGGNISLFNDDDLGGENVQGPTNSTTDGADIATRTFLVLGADTADSKIMRVARTIVRQGEPVQFSLLSLGDAKASEADWQHANSLRFAAKLPFNTSAAFLGLDAMASLMTEPLLFPMTPQASKLTKNSAAEPKTQHALTKAKPKPVVTNEKPKVATKPNGNLAPSFSPLPGPQVKITGTWLKNLPAGYRMHVKTKNYWTNSSMTSTRTSFLALTADGQFEVGSFAVMGGMGGVVGSVFSSDKNGSTGSVFGDTNPGGPGTQSTAITKREGLDPSKYGAYYIAGSTIEMRYANGKIEKKSFKTDGYKELVINDKRYFTGTPKGWEKRIGDGKVTTYRSLDGAYVAKVSDITNDIGNGFQWLRDFLGRMKAKGAYVSATEVQGWKGRRTSYSVVKSTVTVKNKTGNNFSRDIYVKYGRFVGRLVQLDRYAGATGENNVLDFIEYVD